MLVTMRTIGDLGCLEALARAWSQAGDDAWWRSQLVEAAAEIMRREKATGRSAAVKRLRARWPEFLPG
jgi:hypothetical protein